MFNDHKVYPMIMSPVAELVLWSKFMAYAHMHTSRQAQDESSSRLAGQEINILFFTAILRGMGEVWGVVTLPCFTNSPMIGRPGAPQTPLLNGGGSPPGPSVVNYITHELQISPNDVQMMSTWYPNNAQRIPKESPNNGKIMTKSCLNSI